MRFGAGAWDVSKWVSPPGCQGKAEDSNYPFLGPEYQMWLLFALSRPDPRAVLLQTPLNAPLWWPGALTSAPWPALDSPLWGDSSSSSQLRSFVLFPHLPDSHN